MAAARRLLAQVGRLPVEFRRRCTMGAVAGTSVGVYDAACGVPARAERARLRAAAKTAVVHGVA
eukprot:5837961-Lingulodinium_polyedra.AAC.1